MKEKERKRSLLAVFLTFAIDSLSATIVFPIFAPLFLGSGNTIFRSEVPDSFRMLVLGFFLASFPLAQFIFSPILGDLADRRGRKKAFVITIFLSIVGYLLSAFGIQNTHLSILFLGRFITGLAAGNMSICLASLVDLSPNEAKKARYFSYGSIVAGSTFVLGPFIGGKLSDSSLHPWFSPSFPMWIGVILSTLNLIILFFTFKETLRKTRPEYHFDALKAVHNVQTMLHTQSIKNLYTIYFFCLFAWNLVFQFLPAIMVEEFQSTNSAIGDASALMGIIWILGTSLVSFIMHYKVKIKTLLFLMILFFALLAPFVPWPTTMPLFLLFVGLVVFFAGGMWPLFTISISNAAHKAVQGKILGFSQSIQSLSMMLAPLLGGFFIQAHSAVPFLIASASALFSLLLLRKTKLA